MTHPAMAPLFVELCAGTAALSLRLAHPTARPPVSRIGAKTGYADAILRVLGLRPGGGAAQYLWCEPDSGVRLLLEAYRDAELAKAAAAIIRGWADEEPRALWERLRAEGPPREAGGYEVARWVNVKAWEPHDGRYIGPDFTSFTAVTGKALAERMDTAPTLPAAIAPDARAVDPREVARWVWTWGRSFNTKGPEAGFLPSESSTGTQVWNAHPQGWFADRLDTAPTLPATIAPDARAVDPGPSLPPGTVAYLDPPYVGTTGYGHDLGRAEVVELARRWQAAGALVAISEAEPIAELVAEGWHAVEVSGERRGQRRTFSRQQAEWVTMSAEPAWRPAVQGDLFGGGENAR